MPSSNRSALKRVTVTYNVSDPDCCDTTVLETNEGNVGYAAFPNDDNPVAIKVFAHHDTLIVPLSMIKSVNIELNVQQPTDITQVG